MASKGQALTLGYYAWNTGASAGKTGDAANHTLRWVKDGTSAAPTNAPSEVDATNAPGLYQLALTAAECTCDFGTLAGKSSTSGVVILPVSVTFERLPTGSNLVSFWQNSGVGNGAWSLSALFAALDLVDDIYAKTQTIGTSTIYVYAPVVDASRRFTLVKGADYYVDDGMSVDFRLSGMPDLTGAGAALTIPTKVSRVTRNAVTIDQPYLPGSPDWRLRYEYPRAQSGLLDEGQWTAEILVVLDGGHRLKPIKCFPTVTLSETPDSVTPTPP